MTYEKMGPRAVDYMPWRCPGSRLVFRGPRRRLEGDYIVFLGSTETYGRFVEHPFPNLLEERLGIACVNFGWPNAGVDVFLNEPAILDACARARAVVLQLPCVPNMSNRFYSVHPRRNDRFIGPTSLMRSVFPEVDFTEFHFIRHMLRRIGDCAPDRYRLLCEDLQALWVRRMQLLLNKLGGNATLLWFSRRSPTDGHADNAAFLMGPALVSAAMLQAVSAYAGAVVTLRTSDAAQRAGTGGMIFSQFEAAAADKLPGPLAHREAAKALYPVLQTSLA